MKSYSQSGQDIFVSNLIQQPGTFLDLGCYLPKKINNTMLLEEQGWTGVSVDIIDYSSEWSVRKTKFLNYDCLNIDLRVMLENNFQSKIIDYLTLDMEKLGDRVKLLKKALDTGFTFKIITIEHDSYLGVEYESQERDAQRKLLYQNGYILLCKDVAQSQYPEYYFEDWWINGSLMNYNDVIDWRSDRETCQQIFSKMKIQYTIDPISQTW